MNCILRIKVVDWTSKFFGYRTDVTLETLKEGALNYFFFFKKQSLVFCHDCVISNYQLLILNKNKKISNRKLINSCLINATTIFTFYTSCLSKSQKLILYPHTYLRNLLSCNDSKIGSFQLERSRWTPKDSPKPDTLPYKTQKWSSHQLPLPIGL